MLVSEKLPARSSNWYFQAFKNYELLNDGVWLAGGALRHLFDYDDKISDFDLFFKNQIKLHETIMKIEDQMTGNQKTFELVFQCPQGKLRTYKSGLMKVQLVTENYYNDHIQVIERFDIRACRFVYDGKKLYYPYSSARDVKKKEINYHALDFPNATMKRTAKYVEKGYKLTNKAVERFTSELYQRGVDRQPIDGRFYID